MKFFIASLSLLLLLSCQKEQNTSSHVLPKSKYFLHGVASGDPLMNQVIIWTRVSDDSLSKKDAQVFWEIAREMDFNSIVKNGTVSTNASRDFTVKVDVDELDSDEIYYYRFKYKNDLSPIGTTKTLSQKSDSLTFAVVSCSNYEWGYFNAYARIAEKSTLDAVLHLGDYIYEYGPGTYGDTTLERLHSPAKEIITLDDYRKRYAQYRLDKDLQSAHAAHPFISIWDDHEIANDAYTEGAQNHQSTEGDFKTRREIARKVYYEWMPIRESNTHYRKFNFGPLAELYMLDERLEGRNRPAKDSQDLTYRSADRKMISDNQRNWLFDNIKESKTKWKLIGNQVIFSDVNHTPVFPDRPINMDSWDGYPVDKNRVASFIKDNKVKNVVFLTGDTHASWAFDVIVKEVSPVSIATEFGTPSINSSNYDEHSTLDSAKRAESLYTNFNPHLKYANLIDHGYILLSVTAERTTAQYYYVETVKAPSDNEIMGEKLWVKDGRPAIRRFSLYYK